MSSSEELADTEPAPDADDRRMAWLQRGVWTVLIAGVLAFLVRGADNPADPVLVPAVDTSTSTTGPARVASGGGRWGAVPARSASSSTTVPTTSASTATSTAATSPPTSATVPPESTVAPVAPTTTTAAVERRPLAGFGEVAFRVTDAAGSVFDGMALLAATDESRRRGLMEQTDLRGYDGMVFRSTMPSTATFHMRNTRIPLSIAFFDLYGRFVSATDMEPCPDSLARCPAYSASGPYVHAIEVAQGDLGRLGIGPGSVLSFPS